MLLADDFISYFGKKFKVIDIKFPQIPSYLLQAVTQVHPSLHLEVSLYCPSICSPSILGERWGALSPAIFLSS